MTPRAPDPVRPTNVPDLANLCLAALVRDSLGHKISLGGAFGLLCYHDYRPTNDLDAWWEPEATQDDRDRVVTSVRDVLESLGDVRVRAWGDVVSVELVRGAKKVFSFQIAERRVRLQPPKPAPWIDVLLDSFVDLVASKMVALVERGAPRDFRDVYTLCQTGLTTPRAAWRLWRERQERTGADIDPERARLAVETHLGRIERYRPLTKIEDPRERKTAERARNWYKKELLDALLD